MFAKVNKNKVPKITGYGFLRIRFISKGTTINRWAKERGYPFTTVYDAARGRRAGVKAVKIKKEMEEFANA